MCVCICAYFRFTTNEEIDGKRERGGGRKLVSCAYAQLCQACSVSSLLLITDLHRVFSTAGVKRVTYSGGGDTGTDKNLIDFRERGRGEEETGLSVFCFGQKCKRFD